MSDQTVDSLLSALEAASNGGNILLAIAVSGSTFVISGHIIEVRPAGDVAWHFPIGTAEYPPERWYAATLHDPSGAKNNGYRHTGIDINLDVSPWGDVEHGFPVYAVADGYVVDVGSSERWVGVVVIRHEDEEGPVWFRYAHIDPEVQIGDKVVAGQVIGRIGSYSGGDHLHLDCARSPFRWNSWLTPSVAWVDPVPVLKKHLDPERVEAMLRRGDK